MLLGFQSQAWGQQYLARAWKPRRRRICASALLAGICRRSQTRADMPGPTKNFVGGVQGRIFAVQGRAQQKCVGQ